LHRGRLKIETIFGDRFDLNRAAVNAPQEFLLFQFAQVSTDARLRRSKFTAQSLQIEEVARFQHLTDPELSFGSFQLG
jgi:hypothetical protein